MMKTEDAKAWQDSILATAKEALLADTHLVPVALILAPKMGIGDRVRVHLRTMDDTPYVDDGAVPLELVQVGLPLLTDGLYVFQLLRLIGAPGMAKLEEGIEIARKAMPIGEASEEVFRTICRKTGKQPIHFVMGALREILRMVEARAVCTVQEAWVAPMEKKPEKTFAKANGAAAKAPAEEPAGSEVVLTTVETDAMGRTAVLPFVRAEKNVGKVTGFAEPWYSDHDARTIGKGEGMMPGRIRRVQLA